jgi:hypothetical protein
MTDSATKPLTELGVEFVVELLLFFYPYGAEQMGLPHNFWLGLGCWVVATMIAVRMFWIFPLRSHKLSRLEKGLIALLLVGGFIWVFFEPVTLAYHRQKSQAEEKPKESESVPSIQTEPSTTTKHPSETGKQKGSGSKTSGSPTASTSGDKSPAVGSITQGDCGNVIVGGSNNQATTNCGTPPPPPLKLSWSAAEISPSARQDFRYEKEITVTPNVDYSPVSMGIWCNSEIGMVGFNFKTGGAFSSSFEGTAQGNSMLGYVYFESPAVRPNKPLLVYIYSNHPLTVLRVEPTKIPGISD